MAVSLCSTIVVLGACGRGDDRGENRGENRGQATQPPPAATMVAASSDAAVKLAPPPPPALDAEIAAEEQAAIGRLPAGPGHDLVVGNCLICHAATMIEQQHKDTTAWNKTVSQMIAFGSPLPKNQQPVLVTYLASHFGFAGAPRRTVSARTKR